MDPFCLDREGLTSLESGQYLEGEIINTTFHLLLTSSNKKDEVVDYVSPHVFETYRKNKEGDQGMLFVDERKLFLRSTNFAVILLPLCFERHWVLVIYHKPMKSIVFFDSGRKIFHNDKIMSKIAQYLTYLLPETANAAKYVQRGWFQKEDNSCGIYILYYAFCFLRCVTLHHTDFLTYDIKSRQQLKSALEKKKLTGIARLIFPKTQSGGATTHKSVKQFMALNCVPLEEYLKSPSNYDSNPENEIISKVVNENPASHAPEKEKLIFRLRKERLNSEVFTNSYSNITGNSINGEGSRLIGSNNLSPNSTPAPGISPSRINESPPRKISIGPLHTPQTSPPAKQELPNKSTSEYHLNVPQNHQNPHNHNHKEPQLPIAILPNHPASQSTLYQPINQFNHTPVSHLNQALTNNKRKDKEETEGPRAKKLGSSKPGFNKPINRQAIDDLLSFFRDNYGESRPLCPIINSEVTIKIGRDLVHNSESSEEKGIQCEIIPTALFRMIKWRMVDGQVALLFNENEVHA